MAPPHHLNYFDFESLTGAAERLGFDVRRPHHQLPDGSLPDDGRELCRRPALGRACHNRRKKFDLAFEAAGLKETRRAFYRALAEAGPWPRSRRHRGQAVSARPFFIVSSGRSGTAMLHKALSAVQGVEMHHEYMVQITQPLAVRRYLGLIDDGRNRARDR